MNEDVTYMFETSREEIQNLSRYALTLVSRGYHNGEVQHTIYRSNPDGCGSDLVVLANATTIQLLTFIAGYQTALAVQQAEKDFLKADEMEGKSMV